MLSHIQLQDFIVHDIQKLCAVHFFMYLSLFHLIFNLSLIVTRNFKGFLTSQGRYDTKGMYAIIINSPSSM